MKISSLRYFLTCCGLAVFGVMLFLLPATAEAGTVFPSKQIDSYNVELEAGPKYVPTPLSVTEATYTQTVNLDPAVAEVSVDPVLGQYAITAKTYGTTTIEYKWTTAENAELVHKFTVTVDFGGIAPRVRTGIEEDSYFDMQEKLIPKTINLNNLFNGNIDFIQTSFNLTQTQDLFNVVPGFQNSSSTYFYLYNLNEGTTRITIKATDRNGYNASYFFDVSTNWDPVFQPQPDMTLVQGKEYTFNLNDMQVFTDADNDTLHYTIDPVTGVTASINGDILTITSSIEQEFALTIRADDGRNGKASGALNFKAWRADEVGIAGTYPETLNMIRFTQVAQGRYVLAPLKTTMPSETELLGWINDGKARAADSDGDLEFAIDEINELNQKLPALQADTYGLYLYDSSNITLDRVVHLIGIDVVRSQLEQIDRDHENNGLDIMDTHRWLMMYNNTYFNAKVILSLLPS
ncbi:glycerol-3-phosphate responsive antiterminator [Paenibacillus thiaminolyticus]|uniref:glycerol-3-phosphate responsive antiterminator n=1 Tax=Paenibacillus thiaminolyticus TaxID=49283 RepID=UPI0035A5D547